jgi:ATP-binding cassette, subfamily B, bacterial
LRRLMSGRTTIVISHNLLTVRDADVIVVLEHGRVVDRGTHDDLLTRDGIYAQLFRLHVGQSTVSAPTVHLVGGPVELYPADPTGATAR